MAKTVIDRSEFNKLKKDVADGNIGRLYAFYGEERYLLEYYLSEIKKKLIPDGMFDFNFKRLDGKTMTVSELSAAVDSLPVFCERTVIQIDDYDIGKQPEAVRRELLEIISDIPEYACVIFVFDTVEYKLDARSNLNSKLKKAITAVEFAGQEQSDLINWIARRFKAASKQIDRQIADYLIFLSGGLMTKLITEIEKISAYSKGRIVTKEDIDAVVEPTVNAVSYKLTDALVEKKFDTAIEILNDLFAMREAPHKIIYGISLRFRQMYSAWLCLQKNAGSSEIMSMFNIRNEFQTRGIIVGARQCGGKWCREGMRLCAETAKKLNSSPIDGEELMLTLILSIAAIDD